MARWRIQVAASLALIALGATSPQRAGAATPDQVEAALQKGKAFLYAEQQNGIWEKNAARDKAAPIWVAEGGQFTGTTAAAVYALLVGGEEPTDKKLVPAIEFLKKTEPIGIYAIGLRCQVWLMLPRTPEIRRLAHEDLNRLLKGVIKKGPAKDLYGYVTPAIDWRVDHSSSQYGVLGVWACEQMGLEVPTEYWAKTEERWVHDELPDGAWRYGNESFDNWHPDHGTAAMTAAGVATLFITQDYVHQHDGITCKGNLQNKSIEAGLKWMADHHDEWSPHGDLEFFGGWFPNYTMYGVERIGVASGLKYIGATDWYAWGAQKLVTTQTPSGAWGESDGQFGGEHNVINTAYAMLFLARGRAPVIFNKLRYDIAEGKEAGKPGRWNQRPRDVANITRWIGGESERNFNWQIVDLKQPVETLHDAPILYIAGNDALSFSAEQEEKLRLFAQQGGVIVGNADCGATNPVFADSFRKLGRKLFSPADFRVLPDDHSIFTDGQFPARHWKRRSPVLSISNGVREMMMLLPDDPGKYWQLQEFHGDGRDEACQLAADVFQYATDEKTPRFKGDTYLIERRADIVATRQLKVARLKWDGNWDPEPVGWQRLAASLHNTARVDLTISNVDPAKEPLDGFSIASLTGTGRMVLDAAARGAIQKFLDAGGTLVVDAAGGDSEFASSAETLITQLEPTSGQAMRNSLSDTDPIFLAAGLKPEEIRFRAYARKMLGQLKKPEIKAVKVKDRPAIYYSREDLSAGLVGEEMDGIVGYDPATALRIMTGIVLQAK